MSRFSSPPCGDSGFPGLRGASPRPAGSREPPRRAPAFAGPGGDGASRTMGARTRRVYDRLAAVYPLPSLLFHSRAHRCALEMAGIRDGMRVLEVATGSGEMFRRLVRANPAGCTVGVDLSPRMAARTHRLIRRGFPGVRAHCQAVDARSMPFRDETFDAVICCYLLELLAPEDILRALGEMRRVLRVRGSLTLVAIGEDGRGFDRLYRLAGQLAPAFWGRPIGRRLPELLQAARLRLIGERLVRQAFYPSRVLLADRA